MDRIEALALCIAKFSGGFDPESLAFRCSNPGALKAFVVKKFLPDGQGGLRSFRSWTAGMDALIFDLRTKCEGRSRAKLGVNSTLGELLATWGVKVPRKPILYVRRATGEATVGRETPLSWFLQARNESGNGAAFDA